METLFGGKGGGGGDCSRGRINVEALQKGLAKVT